MIGFLLVLMQFCTVGFAQPGSLISQVLQARNDIPPGANFAADIVNKRPSTVPGIILPSPTIIPSPAPQPTSPIPSPVIPPSPTSPTSPTLPGSPIPTPASPTPPTPTPRPGNASPRPVAQPSIINPIIAPKPVVVAAPQSVVIAPQPVIVKRDVQPQPVVVKKDPQPVRVVKQEKAPVVSKKAQDGITIVVVPENKCTKLEDILKNTPELSILAQALQAAKLESPKQKENTIFAPTNEAFEKVAQQFDATLEEIVQDPNLGAILLYHFVPGKLLKLKDLTNNQSLQTRLEDQKLTVDKPNADVVNIEAFASKAKVVKGDVQACDLVVHVIDTVLLPQI